MTLPFADRPPTDNEVERLRLILSTYQDGTGMNAVKAKKRTAKGETTLQEVKGATTLPGWRDFERAVASAFNGIAQESKAIYDVHLPESEDIGHYVGISCKMRGELKRIARDGRITIELSNSAGKFWTRLGEIGINQTNYKTRPAEVGRALLELVESWHEEVSIANGGNVDTERSIFLTLMWSPDGRYQLHQFPIQLPDPDSLRWYFAEADGELGRCLKGDDNTGTIIEWYGESGGQLKYYPLAKNAVWQSDVFTLEPLTPGEYGIAKKAEVYFPEKWGSANE